MTDVELTKPASVTVSIDGGVADITLARPDRGNAMDLDMAHAMRDAVFGVGQESDVGAVLLHGAGPAFCVGGDLRSFAAAASATAYVDSLAGTMHEVILLLRRLPAPVVCAVQGACAGGGIGLALAADIVVAECTTRIQPAYVDAGLSPDCGTSWALTCALGAARASDLILTNRRVDGVEAERLGLVSRVVADGGAHEEALAIARELAAGPRAALSRSVRLVRAAGTTPLAEHLDAERTAIAAQVGSSEGVEGIAAFHDKRRPDFARDRMPR